MPTIPKITFFELKKVLPAGMAFPYDFGFVPSTEADDGDPVDVLVLMDEPAFPGRILKCPPIGVIQGEQGDKRKKVRNDRIIAVERDAHSWADIKAIGDLGSSLLGNWKNSLWTITSFRASNAACSL